MFLGQGGGVSLDVLSWRPTFWGPVKSAQKVVFEASWQLVNKNKAAVVLRAFLVRTGVGVARDAA